MSVRGYAILMSLFVLMACSTVGRQPQMTAAEISTKLRSSRVNVQPVSKPIMLTERTKAQATGNFLLSSLVSSAMGSAGNASNPHAFQANTEIARTFGQQMQQALPEGAAVASGQGADIALAGHLAEYFAGMQANEFDDEVFVQVRARKWELAYKSFLGSSDYALHYDFEVVVSEAQPAGIRVLKTASCLGEFRRRMPLDDWRNEDYREVNVATEEIVESCFERILKQMELPVLEGA